MYASKIKFIKSPTFLLELAKFLARIVRNRVLVESVMDTCDLDNYC